MLPSFSVIFTTFMFPETWWVGASPSSNSHLDASSMLFEMASELFFLTDDRANSLNIIAVSFHTHHIAPVSLVRVGMSRVFQRHNFLLHAMFLYPKIYLSRRSLVKTINT